MRLFFSLTLFFISVCMATGEDIEDFYIVARTTDVLDFDGICNEALWDNLVPLQMHMYRPNHGGVPTEKTEIDVSFYDQYFYFGGRMHYTNGAELKASNKKRDGIDGGSDNFGILLDTFNDNETALCY